MNASYKLTQSLSSMRLDKWLWAARFYKTRALAVRSINKGQVQVNGSSCKPSREIRCGDSIVLRTLDNMPRTVIVAALSRQRGSATVAQTLYSETEESIKLRTQLAQNRRMAPDFARGQTRKGRPTKRDRRELQKFKVQQEYKWNLRWRAEID